MVNFHVQQRDNALFVQFQRYDHLCSAILQFIKKIIYISIINQDYNIRAIEGIADKKLYLTVRLFEVYKVIQQYET
jgi:hypothetical protein